MPTLRDYQVRDKQRIQRALTQYREVLYVSPTGSGKTTLVCDLIGEDVSRGLRVGFLAHRKELIDQCSARLRDHGIGHGIIMSGHDSALSHAVQVASIQTLIRRNLPPLDKLYVDEAHHAASESYQRIVQAYPNLLALVGLTATPCRLDGRGLGDCFGGMVIGSTTRELMASGWLVPTRVFAPSTPDIGSLHSRGGDYIAAEMQAMMDKPKITGNIVAHWLRLAPGRQTVIFATGVKHSQDIVAAFEGQGVAAAHLDADTPKEVREEILADLTARRLLVVVNCAILTEGWDCPAVSCVVLARPTKSLGLYLQMVGRTLRPAADKADCLVLDHAGCTLRHGFVSENREWTLDPTTRRPQAKDNTPSVRLCLTCYAAYESQDEKCPYCGTAAPIQAREIKQAEGELSELNPNYNIRHISRNPVIRQLQEIAAKHQYKPGWVFFQLQRMRRGLKPQLPIDDKAASRIPVRLHRKLAQVFPRNRIRRYPGRHTAWNGYFDMVASRWPHGLRGTGRTPMYRLRGVRRSVLAGEGRGRKD